MMFFCYLNLFHLPYIFTIFELHPFSTPSNFEQGSKAIDVEVFATTNSNGTVTLTVTVMVIVTLMVTIAVTVM